MHIGFLMILGGLALKVLCELMYPTRHLLIKPVDYREISKALKTRPWFVGYLSALATLFMLLGIIIDIQHMGER